MFYSLARTLKPISYHSHRTPTFESIDKTHSQLMKQKNQIYCYLVSLREINGDLQRVFVSSFLQHVDTFEGLSNSSQEWDCRVATVRSEIFVVRREE